MELWNLIIIYCVTMANKDNDKHHDGNQVPRQKKKEWSQRLYKEVVLGHQTHAKTQNIQNSQEEY